MTLIRLGYLQAEGSTCMQGRTPAKGNGNEVRKG
jgi:hypothetical protein